MKNTSHSFDREGLLFSAKFILLAAIIGISGHYDILSYGALHGAPSPSPVVSLQAGPLVQTAEAAELSTTTPQRVINSLTIPEAVPSTGKFIVADLVHMELYLYQDGTTTAEYQILTKGNPGTPYDTPAGVYSVLTKEPDHVNKAEGVNMPYSMQFYGNYFIHGWPTYLDGTPVASTYSGGCIRLSTADAEKVYDFATIGTGIFVYDPGSAATSSPLSLAPVPVPEIDADSYLVADLDTGDVYAERDADAQRPIASVTKLMTALVANETIMFNDQVTVPRGELHDTDVATDTAPETFIVGDLLYPLLMESNNNIADTLGQYYSTDSFVAWMNAQAKALDMASTTYVDASGVSKENVSTADDLYRLAVYLTDKKSFIWDITRTPQKTITATNGSQYTFGNYNEFSSMNTFVGGKVGDTAAAKDTMVSVFSLPVDGQDRRIAIIVLGADNFTTETQNLLTWFKEASQSAANTGCATCTQPASQYPKIQL